MDKRQGIPFQNFVGTIMRTFAGSENVTVEVGKVIPDDATGRARDFDIYITAKFGPHTMATAIECKDKGRPIDVPAVEAFSKKCQRHGIGRMVMVSSSGFTNTAHEVAKAEHVMLMTLKEAETFDWMPKPVLMTRQKRLGRVHMTFDTDGQPCPSPFVIFDTDGVEATPMDLIRSCESPLVDSLELPEGVQTEYHKVLGPFVLIDPNGNKVTAKAALLEINYTWSESAEPLALHSYSGDDGRVEVASSKVKINGVDARFLLRKTDDEIGIFMIGEEPLVTKPMVPVVAKSVPKIPKPNASATDAD
jgi:hypothetical protein